MIRSFKTYNRTATHDKIRHRPWIIPQAVAGYTNAYTHTFTSTSSDFVGFDFTGELPNSVLDKQEFDRLADEWENETQALSSDAAIKGHNAYLAIKKMGGRTIPWILDRLRPDGGSWFYLLDELATNPPEIERGNVRQIILAWKKWGRDNARRT